MNDRHNKARAKFANLYGDGLSELELHSLAAGRQYDPYGQERISFTLENEWSRLLFAEW